LTIVASGGIRNGIEICKAITLGADVAACALPFLKAAQKSEDAVVDTIEGLKEEIRTTMFVVGAKNIIQLKKSVLRRARDLTAEVWPA
jgi:isopentenyl-diphosphate delta-isomerase